MVIEVDARDAVVTVPVRVGLAERTTDPVPVDVAATDKVGALLGLATLGVSQDGHVPVPKDVTSGPASAELGIGLAATDREGVVVGVDTVGTNQSGQEADGASNSSTVPVPPCVANGTPFWHTYITVLGHPDKNTGSDPEQVAGSTG